MNNAGTRRGSALVVEDEWLIRMEITDALAEAGWRVTELGSGEAAVELLATNAEFDLLVTDIRLSGVITGWDVAERYRAAHSRIVVIYCSGNKADQSRRVSGSHFLPKPCRIDLLLQLRAPSSAQLP